MSDKCRIKIMPDAVKGWKIEARGDCEEEFSFLADIPTRRRNYLMRRIQIER